MAQRAEPKGSLDDFPTPPWATRALMEHVINDMNLGLTCLEPACGAGHMANVLAEYFSALEASDVADYGYGIAEDFLSASYEDSQFDWIITNPPFGLAEQFAIKALRTSRLGVALLVRTVFIESVGRYERLFKRQPPTLFAQFVERVPMVRGRLDAKASTATGYSWLVWSKSAVVDPTLVWIPPCRRQLEKCGDYPADGCKVESRHNVKVSRDTVDKLRLHSN